MIFLTFSCFPTSPGFILEDCDSMETKQNKLFAFCDFALKGGDTSAMIEIRFEIPRGRWRQFAFPNNEIVTSRAVIYRRPTWRRPDETNDDSRRQRRPDRYYPQSHDFHGSSYVELRVGHFTYSGPSDTAFLTAGLINFNYHSRGEGGGMCV